MSEIDEGATTPLTDGTNGGSQSNSIGTSRTVDIVEESVPPPRTKLDYVRRYQSLGWALFPTHSWEGDSCSCGNPECPHPGKHPVYSVGGEMVAPNGFKNATNDLPTLLHWFSEVCPWANVAVATGEPSGIDVIDIDTKNAGEGFRSWRAYLSEVGLSEPDTLRAQTGGGGEHLFFDWTPGLRNRSRWLKSVDFKTTGGYVVLPPSEHASGRPYTWPETSDRPSAINLPPVIRKTLSAASKRGDGGERLPDPASILAGIPLGKRDDMLFRWACQLRRLLGDDSRDLIVFLVVEAAKSCVPPFPEEQALRKVEQAYKQDHADESGDTTHADGIRKSDGGNGIRFARRFGHKAIYIAGPGWYEWDGSVWRSSKDVEIERLGKDVVEDLYDLARHPDLKASDRTKAFTFASRADSPHGIKSMLTMARSDEGLLHWPNDLDPDPLKFAVKNGVVDLRTGELLDTTRFDLITSRSPYAYDPTVATPRWSTFMDWAMSGDAEMVRFLQRLAGLALMGEVFEHIMPVMLGSGRNGKNTYVETLTNILGDFAMFPFPTAALTANDMDPQATARLYGKRLAVASEANKRVPLNSATVNSYTGDGQLFAKVLYQDTFTFRTTHLLMFVANNRPKVNDTKDGIWSRLKLVKWQAKITDQQKVPNYHRVMLAEEGPGIVAWCVAGAMDYLAHGLQVPASVAAESESYRAQEDVLGSFVKKHIVAGPDEFTTREVLKSTYAWWCEAQDIEKKEREGIRDLLDSLGDRFSINTEARHPQTGTRRIAGISIKNSLAIAGL